MTPAQKWVLGLILLILAIHWLLPSGSKQPRIVDIWKAAFSPGGGPTAPTSSGNVSVPSLGQGVPGSQGQDTPLPQIGVNPSACDQVDLPSQTQCAQAIKGIIEAPLIQNPLDTLKTLAIEIASGPPTVPDAIQTNAYGKYNLTVSGRLMGTSGTLSRIMQADGYFTFINPNTNQRIWAFSPNLQGRLLPAPPNVNGVIKGGIPLATNVGDAMTEGISTLTAPQLTQLQSKNAITGGGPPAWWSYIAGVR